MSAVEMDLSAFRYADGWFYKDFRIQADPNAHRFVVEYLSKTAYETVLDLGSGNGAIPAQLMDAGLRVSATSWDGRCKVGNAIYELNLDNGFALEDVGGEQFDAITAIDIIEHLENPWALLRSCARALKSDGVLIVSTPNTESVRSRVEYLIKGYSSDFDHEELHQNRHITPIWRLQFYAMAAQAGLRVRETFAFGKYKKVSFVKRVLFRTLEKVLPGSATGTTRLWVLDKNAEQKPIGPGDVY